MALRWGICCSGFISHDFTCGLSTLDPAFHTVAAVASRSAERAKKLAELHQIPKAYGSYEELAVDDDIGIDIDIGIIFSSLILTILPSDCHQILVHLVGLMLSGFI